MDVEPVLLRDMKKAQERHGVLLVKILGRDRQPLAVEHEATERSASGAPAHPGKPASALLVGLENRTEDPGQVPHIFRDQEIILHEPFNPTAPFLIGVAHAPPDFSLEIESEALFGAAR